MEQLADKEESYKFWAACNDRQITPDVFERIVGTSFKSFTDYRSNRKGYLSAWRELMDKKKSQRMAITKATRRPKKGCICSWEGKQPPNSTSGNAKVPTRLWHCPEHGNCFAHTTLNS